MLHETVDNGLNSARLLPRRINIVKAH